ncbi:MAG: potassium transporter TrkG [Eubacteriales bacterium]|nr:potassium transporter TrkG [Eubacteriales bacterium]
MNWLKKMSYPRIIALTVIAVILAGTVLLCLPVATKGHGAAAPVDALFTAVSATCVTGLIVKDTAGYWSVFGQIVILLMIQVGGIGLMTIITTFSIFLKRHIGLRERRILEQAAGSDRISGVVRLIRRIIRGTVICEGIGAVLLASRMVPVFGWWRGLYTAVFLSVSSFCNAGFDVLGDYDGGASLSAFQSDPVVILTIAALIISGGIGFLVWSDLVRFGRHLRRYSLTSKVGLATTAVLLALGTVVFLATEGEASMAGMEFGERLLNSFFASVTPRTAGYASIDYTQMSEPGLAMTMILMFIGGNSGSTAGGIKTTTFAVLILTAAAMAQGRRSTTVFRRTVSADLCRLAGCVVTIYLVGTLTAAMAVSALEGATMEAALFECISAIGTVGLSLNMTPTLGTASKLILTCLMFGGRIGGMSLLLVLAERRPEPVLKRPEEKLLVG